MSVRRHAQLRETLPDRIELVPAGGLVEAERAVKEPAELAAIRAAAALADEVYALARSSAGWSGRTERESRSRSSRRCACAAPRARASRRSSPRRRTARCRTRRRATSRSRPDTLVTLDIGARVDGYCSDCTRDVGDRRAADDLAELYETVLRAQEAALAAVRPGPEGREVDAVARDLIAAAGHGDHFGHGLGHGVGLDIHEAPRLARTAEARLEAGNVVTVEPGIYVPGRGGARIEDLVVVTADGREVLSATTKALDRRGLETPSRADGPQAGALAGRYRARWNFEPASAHSRAAPPSLAALGALARLRAGGGGRPRRRTPPRRRRRP